MSAIDEHSRSLYVTYENDHPLPTGELPGRNLLYQYRIRPNGSLVGLHPPFVKASDGIMAVMFLKGTDQIAVQTNTSLDIFRPDQRGGLRRIRTTPLPDRLSLFSTNFQNGLILENSVPHYRIKSDGSLATFSGPIILPNGKLSPSGRTCVSEVVGPHNVQGDHTMSVSRVRAGHEPVLRALTRLPIEKDRPDVIYACTDRFVYCTQGFGRGGAMNGPSPCQTRAYRILPNGHLSMIPHSGVRPAGDAYPLIDPSGHFLYIIGNAGLADAQGTLDVYRIGHDGRAKWLQTLHGFGAIGSIHCACFPTTKGSHKM